MEFKKYTSITNSYDKKFIEKIKEFGFDKGMYHVTEKVHGANFAIYYDGDRFRIASRQRFLADDANFYGCQKLLPELKEKIIVAFKNLYLIPMPDDGTYGFKEQNKEIVIFGELCGGTYNHPDVKPSTDAKKVQGHVWYHPDNLFYVFDIKLNGRYLERFLYGTACKKVDFFWNVALFSGSLDECLAFDNAYQTKIPAKFGLPEIENNICEGNVIKPAENIFFPNGDRVILKNKNDKFKEVKKIKDPGKKVELSERANILLIILLGYITQNRLDNLISKIGEPSIKEFGAVMKFFSYDILAEFRSVPFNKDEMEYLTPFEQKMLRKTMNKNAANLIRNYFIK